MSCRIFLVALHEPSCEFDNETFVEYVKCARVMLCVFIIEPMQYQTHSDGDT